MANLMFNAGMIGAIVFMAISIVGYLMGGR